MIFEQLNADQELLRDGFRYELKFYIASIILTDKLAVIHQKC